MPPDIPPALARNVLQNWAGQGEAWLARLPALVEEVAAEWQLTVGEPALIQVGRRLHRDPPPGCALPDVGKERASFRAHLRRFPGDHPLVPVERVVAWGFVYGVLSEVWNVEGTGTVGTRALDVALLLLPRR